MLLSRCYKDLLCVWFCDYAFNLLEYSNCIVLILGMWWVMVSLTALVGAVAEKNPIPCEEARMKCAYRVGCGMALQNYLMGCSAVLQGPPPTYCPETCQHSLIALTSTEEGKELMRVSTLSVSNNQKWM